MEQSEVVVAAGVVQEDKALVNLSIEEVERVLARMKEGSIAGIAIAAVMEDGTRYYGASDLIVHSQSIGTELAFGLATRTR